MMTVDQARSMIQKTIDDPLIDQVKKRQLFGLYQNLTYSTALTPELEKLVNSLCPNYK
jgi:hypothetical protein